jgi:hypothetical protein
MWSKVVRFLIVLTTMAVGFALAQRKPIQIGTNALNLWKFHVDFGTPSNSTFTGPTSIPVAAFSPACNGGSCIPQSGTSQKLDSLGDRLMYRLAYRNFSDHILIVWPLTATHDRLTGDSGKNENRPAARVSQTGL